MAGDRQRVRRLLDETQAAMENMAVTFAEASTAFDEEFPTAPQPQPPGPIIRVAVGDDVQAAFESARVLGATLLLAVGEHRCNLIVDPDETARPVLMTSDTENLPPEGTRITRDYLEGIACLRSANGIDPAIRYRPRATGLNLTGLGILSQQPDRTLIVLGTDDMHDPDEQPTSIVHDRLLLVGDPQLGQHRGIQAHARGYAVLNSSFLDIHEEGRDSQALAAWNGGQYLVLRNCCFEASGENVLFGGGAARTEAMAPQHVLIEGCTFTKNYDWTTLEHEPTVKCLLELKHLRHGTIRQCLFEHCWKAAWDGIAIAIKCTDQAHDEPWTLTEDIRLEHNRIRRVGAFCSIVGANDDGYTTQLMRGLMIRHNLVTELDVAPWLGRGAAFLISNMPQDLVIDHNTILGNNYSVAELSFNQDAQGTGFTLTNTALWQGAYGIKGPAGMDAWDWETDLGYAPTVSGTARRRHPDRTPNWGPGNEVIAESDFDASIEDDGVILQGSPVDEVVTTDGTPIGCDVAALPPG